MRVEENTHQLSTVLWSLLVSVWPNYGDALGLYDYGLFTLAWQERFVVIVSQTQSSLEK